MIYFKGKRKLKGRGNSPQIHRQRKSATNYQPSAIKLTCGLLFLFILFSTSSSAQDLPDSLHPIQLPDFGISWHKPSGETQFSGTNISKEDIDRHTGNGSINNILELIPSMITTSDAGTGLGYTYMRIRGIDQTRINVTINGIALNDAESQGSWFVNLPDLGSKVQQLTVQRGVGTSNNGSAAFGATMDFATLDNSDQRFFEISSSAGSFYTFRNVLTFGTGRIADCFSATLSYSNLMSNGYVDYASAKMHNLFFSSDFYLKNKKKNKNHGKIKLNILYGNEKTGLAWNGVPSDSLKTNRRHNSCGEYHDTDGKIHHYPNESDNYQQVHSQLFYDFSKNINENNAIKVNAGLHFTPGNGYYEEYKELYPYDYFGLENPILTNDTLSHGDFITRKCMNNYFYGLTFAVKQSLKLNVPNTHEKDNGHQLSWSVGGCVNHYDGKHYGTIEWAQYAGAPEHYHWYDGTGKKTQFNLYGTVDYSHDRWYTYIDLQYRLIDYRIGGTDENRLDINQHYLWHFFNPKIGFSVDVDAEKHHSLYASLARSQREPTRSDIIEAPTQRKPVPETLYDLEIGYRLQYQKYAFNANFYFMYYDKQLVLTGEINSVGAAIMTNVDKSYRTGIELISTYRPVKFFLWNIKGTFSINKILDYTEYIDDWDSGTQRVNHLGTTDISFSPNIVASNEFVFTPVANFNISLATQFVSRQFIDNSSNKDYSLKPYCVSNLNFSYCLHTKTVSDIEFFFRINNLFNAKYESNAWIYRYYLNGSEYCQDGYFPQATINFMGGVRLKFGFNNKTLN